MTASPQAPCSAYSGRDCIAAAVPVTDPEAMTVAGPTSQDAPAPHMLSCAII